MQDFRCYSTNYANSVQPNQLGKEIKMKKSKSSFASSSKTWSFNDPELQRKKRVASYKFYAVEGKMKGSLRKSFRWIKDTYTQVVYGWRWSHLILAYSLLFLLCLFLCELGIWDVQKFLYIAIKRNFITRLLPKQKPHLWNLEINVSWLSFSSWGRLKTHGIVTEVSDCLKPIILFKIRSSSTVTDNKNGTDLSKTILQWI